jgi:hypothetical protein
MRRHSYDFVPYRFVFFTSCADKHRLAEKALLSAMSITELTAVGERLTQRSASWNGHRALCQMASYVGMR